MVCQTCDERDTCTKLCDRAEKYMGRGFKKSIRETLIGREVKYDNSSIWPDDPDRKTDPDVLAMQAKRPGRAGTEFLDMPLHKREDDIEHLGDRDRKWIQAPGLTTVSYADACSYWKAESVNFSCLTPLQNRLLYEFYFPMDDRVKIPQIAQKVNRKVNVVKGQLQRARAKLRSFYSKSERNKILFNDDGKPILDKKKAHKDYPYDPDKHEGKK